MEGTEMQEQGDDRLVNDTEKQEDQTTNRIEKKDVKKVEKETPVQTSGTEKPQEPSKPEEKKVDVKQPPEGEKPSEETVPKKAFLKRLSDEARKRSADKSRIAQLEAELATARTTGQLKTKVEDFIRDTEQDPESAAKLRQVVADSSVEMSGFQKTLIDNQLKPQKVESALDTIIEEMPELEEYREQMKAELDRTTNIALLDDKYMLVKYGYEVRGQHSNEIYDKKMKEETTETETKITEAGKVVTSTTGGSGGGTVQGLTAEEKTYVDNTDGMSVETALKIKEKRGGIPGCSC